MEQIQSIYLNALLNEEHTGFCSYVASYLDEVDLSALKIDESATDFKEKLLTEKNVLDVTQKNSHTKAKDDLDRKRRSVIKGFCKSIDGMLHHFQPSMAKAAYNISLINERFGKIDSNGYEKQTQLEESFLKDIKDDWDEIKKLGLTEWINEIEKNHNAFIQVVGLRNQEIDNKPAINMRTARSATDAAYYALANRINAFITIDNDSGVYTPLVIQINGRIGQYMMAMAKRKGRTKKDDTEKNETQE